MAQKTIVPVFSVFSAALANQTMTGTNVLTSPVTNIIHKDNLCYAVSWTGTPSGTFAVQTSSDYNPGLPQGEPAGPANSGTWTTIPALDNLGNPPVASGSAGQIRFDLNELPDPYVRLIYTNASGSGVLSGTVSGKALGV